MGGLNGARTTTRSVLVAALLAVAGLTGCGSTASILPPQVNPYKIEKIPGSDIARLHLEPKAVERIELRTEEVQAMPAGGATTSSVLIPYGGLLFRPDGGTFVYTNPEGSTFVRHSVTVERYDGDRVVVSNGPPVGTRVVTDGAAELWGVEFGVGK